MKSKSKFWLVMAAFAVLPLVACSNSSGDGKTKPDQMVATISPYNHTPDYIHQFYVDGQGGGNSRAYGGGGSFVCCIAYPKQWRPGLTAQVRWTTSSSDPNATGDDTIEKWHEKVVPIDRYDEPGSVLNVHFLPQGEVRLVISNTSAAHPNYPGPKAPEKPASFPY
ncbi:DUF3304 domain-containing protein [Pseudorhodoferax sp.]|uniref:DUF3304 domain-containing protein n=1 Tax=Pseudorhodoferax sp. TaxID=1993553 RepID=UPI0039E42774